MADEAPSASRNGGSGVRTVCDLDLQNTRALPATPSTDLADQLEPGDLVLARSTGTWMAEIIAGLDGYWTHAALYAGPDDTGAPQVVHAYSAGVGAVPLDEFVNRYPGGLGVARPNRPAEQRTAAARHALERASAEPTENDYSGWDLGVAFAMLRRARARGAWRLPDVAENDLELFGLRWPWSRKEVPVFSGTCSGFVYSCYRDGAKAPLTITPAPGLKVENGMLIFPDDEEDLYAATAAEPATDGGMWASDLEGVGRPNVGQWRDRILLIGEVVAAWATFASVEDRSIPLDQGVSPSDLWCSNDVTARWFVTTEHARLAADATADCARTDGPAGPTYDHLLEDYPDSLAESLAERDEWRATIAAASDDLEFIVSDIVRWKPGSTVTVAFRGGTRSLHEAIHGVVQAISRACSLTLDFGHPGGGDGGGFRTWSTDDREYSADIRIGFDVNGYWSLVGTDSVDPSIGRSFDGIGGRPHQQSMNFGGYTEALPSGWQRTVLHEFLHALAFKHEHQNMRGPCQHQFRWDDDDRYVPTTDSSGRFVADPQGRRPGIYTYLGGPPNNWSRAKVDHNLRSAGAEDGVASAFDPASVMLYRFPPLFYQTNPSPCGPVGQGLELSDGDKRGLQLLYPDVEDEGVGLSDRAKHAHRELADAPAHGSADPEFGALESTPASSQESGHRAGTRAVLERIWT